MQEQRFEALEKRIAELEQEVATLKMTTFDPQRAAEVMVAASKGKRKRGVAGYF